MCCYYYSCCCSCMDCNTGISFLHMRLCMHTCNSICKYVCVLVCVWLCVCLCASFIYITETVDIMDFLFMLSAYAGCPELNRFSPSFLFPSTHIRGHIVGVVNLLVLILMFAPWTFFLRNRKTYSNYFTI